MPRRPPPSKRRRGPEWAGFVPAPWQSMDADAEDAARAAYLAAREHCGAVPVMREREGIVAYRERMGGRAGFSLWAAARFDPAADVRRLALVSGVDHIRFSLVTTLWLAEDRWWDQSDRPPRHEAIGGFSAWRLDNYGTGSYKRRALSASAAAEEQPGIARVALQALAEDAATMGLLVSEKRVLDIRDAEDHR